MTEYGMGWLGSASLALVALFSTLYWLGGRNHKWLRRWVGSVVFVLGLLLLTSLYKTFSWWFLPALLGYPLALSMGYGVNWEAPFVLKLARRLIYGGFLGAQCLWFAIPADHLTLGVWQMILALLFSGYGVESKINAPHEETLIATMSVILVPFMIGP